MAMTFSADRILGCIMGGAIGDAMGFLYEGQDGPLEYDETTLWQISDDTQLTLCTCEAITESGTVDPQAIATNFAHWFRQRRFRGLGASTYKALSELAHGGHWWLVGSKGERAAGNGAACRIAPLAFWLAPDDEKDRVLLRDVCRITHHSDEAYIGALAVVYAIRWAATGQWHGGFELLTRIAGLLPDSSVRDRLIRLHEFGPEHSIVAAATQFGCSGYVVESVPLALYSSTFFLKDGYKQTLETIISAGGDCDTIASIAGQLMGTLCGFQELPIPMLAKLPERAEIHETAKTFSDSVCPKKAR